MKHILQNSRGLTLIEIIVTMTIIAIFATIAFTQVGGYVGKARINAAKTQIKNFEQALELYKTDNDFFPTTEQGLHALIAPPTVGNVPENYPPEGYLKKKDVPKDPWNTPYVYICEDGEKYSILSYGPDKKEGGTGKGADISSDDL
ncbi:MAG: type II secretion system major pseudopilin GspG [Deltaproteobacteria bacterium]|nr:type II secretion system major pseudopilin GspG [Deltaproteobacteria bacterium]MBI3017954.1 type II secretion system major pseudopilin GspG [Deltaproteobacteria bacterium]